MSLLATKGNTFEFVLILIIFVLVLAATWAVTKWTAGYQKKRGVTSNIEVRESCYIANNKFIQLVRIGQKYYAVAVCKDTVTMLCEVSADELKDYSQEIGEMKSFKELFRKAIKKESENPAGESLDEADYEEISKNQ